MNTTRSEQLFERARAILPGGVNSPVRAFRGVGGVPRFIASASGARMTDADGNSYLDYVLSWGPMILGHAHPEVNEAIAAALAKGTSYGAPTEAEIELAELVRERVPSAEMLRMVSSGTEAGMAVIRLARGFTGREKILKMSGCYHGHADSLLVSAGSGVATLGLPDSPGVTPGASAGTIVVPFNSLAAVREAFAAHPGEIAAVLVEPVAGNMGMVEPLPGYLPGLREITEREGALLIFDEVMTGFRVAPGGAQALFGVKPDLTMFGKVIGGGLPVGAYGGRAEIMLRIAPAGPIYQAGTLSGNPLAVAAGLATLRILGRPGTYERLGESARRLAAGLAAAGAEAGVPVCAASVGSMFGFFLQSGPVVDYATARNSDTALYGRFFHAMLEEGVYFAPSQFEAGFVSTAHRPEDIDFTLAAARRAFVKAKGERSRG